MSPRDTRNPAAKDPTDLVRAVSWLYGQVPDHVLTDPENEDHLTRVEEWLETYGLEGGE